MAKSNRMVIWGVLGAIALFLSIAGYTVFLRAIPRSAQQLFIQGSERLRVRDFQLGFQYIKSAADREPGNTNYLWGAAVAASKAGLPVESYRYLTMAWKAGFRSTAAVRLLLDVLPPVDKERDLRAVQLWIAELPQGKSRTILESEVLRRYGHGTEAVEVLRRSMAQSMDPEIGQRLAQAFISLGQVQDAQGILTRLEEAGALREDGFSLLAATYSLSPSTYSRALEVFDRARQRGRSTARLEFEEGILHLLNLRGGAANAVFARISRATTNAPDPDLLQTCRLFLAYDALSRKDTSILAELRTAAASAASGPRREGELLFLSAVEGVLRARGGASEGFEKASRLLPPHPVVALVWADELVRQRKPSEALAILDTIRGPIQRWVPLLMTRSRALTQAGRFPDAMSALEEFHTQGLMTPESLALYRDLCVQLNRPEAARQVQQVFEKQFPNHVEARLFKGFVALSSGDTNGAVQIFEDLVRRFPADQRPKLAKVQILVNVGRFAEALDLLESLKLADALSDPLRGAIRLRLGDPARAAEILERALRSPQPASVNLQYARALGLLGRSGEATNQFALALSKDAGSEEARLGLAMAAYASRDIPQARDHVRQLFLAPAGRTERAFVLVAEAELENGQFTQALHYSEQAIAGNPRSEAARFLRAQALAGLGRNAEALRDLGTIVQVAPANVPALELSARLHLRAGDYANAEVEVNQLLKLAATNATYGLIKLELLGATRRFVEAEALLTQLGSGISRPRATLARAWLSERRGDTNRALTVLEADLSEKDVAIQWARLSMPGAPVDQLLDRLRQHPLGAAEWAALGVIAESLQRPEMAERLYREAIQVAPEDPELMNNWAWNAIQLPGRDLGAIFKVISKAHELAPNSEAVLDTYSEALVRASRYREAVSLLEKSGPVLRSSAQLTFLLAQAYEGLADRSNALGSYSRASELASREKSWPIRTPRAELQRRIQQLQAAVN